MSLQDLSHTLLSTVIKYLDLCSVANLQRVNRAFCSLVNPNDHCTVNERVRRQRINRLRHQNVLWDFVKQHPEFDWDYDWLSKHENIPVHVILENPKLPWSWHIVLSNPNIAPDVELTHNHPWNWTEVNKIPNVNLLEMTIRRCYEPEKYSQLFAPFTRGPYYRYVDGNFDIIYMNSDTYPEDFASGDYLNI